MQHPRSTTHSFARYVLLEAVSVLYLLLDNGTQEIDLIRPLHTSLLLPRALIERKFGNYYGGSHSFLPSFAYPGLFQQTRAGVRVEESVNLVVCTIETSFLCYEKL